MANRSSTSETDYFGMIPVDLLINNILSKLPVKCKAKCRCVSKQWSSIIRRPNYNQLFPIKSCAPSPPRLLFALRAGSKLFFFSSPEMNSSAVPTTLHHTKKNQGSDFRQLCRPVRGLVCSQHIAKKHSWAVISNPITGESVTTPKVTIEYIEGVSGSGKAQSCFGYDPIDKHFKVLLITWFTSNTNNWYAKYHVLTLGNHHYLWRKIQCCVFHYPLEDNGICINGFLYYPAMTRNKKLTIVCFDVRSEIFSFINVDQDMAKSYGPLILFNYRGRLGVQIYRRGQSEVWVLEEHKWSKPVFIVHHPFPGDLRVAGIIASGELVLYSIFTQDPFFIFYYNLNGSIITRVRLEIPVTADLNYCTIYTFPNFVEDVKLLM